MGKAHFPEFNWTNTDLEHVRLLGGLCTPAHRLTGPDSSGTPSQVGPKACASLGLSTQAESCLGEGLETGFTAQKQSHP